MIHHGLSDHTLLRPKPQKHPSNHRSQPNKEDVGLSPVFAQLGGIKTLGDVLAPKMLWTKFLLFGDTPQDFSFPTDFVQLRHVFVKDILDLEP